VAGPRFWVRRNLASGYMRWIYIRVLLRRRRVFVRARSSDVETMAVVASWSPGRGGVVPLAEGRIGYEARESERERGPRRLCPQRLRQVVQRDADRDRGRREAQNETTTTTGCGYLVCVVEEEVVVCRESPPADSTWSWAGGGGALAVWVSKDGQLNLFSHRLG
jgi:hypothetical protein